MLIASYFLLPKYGFTSCSGIVEHILYSISHANIWHLLANVLCLFVLRCPTHIISAFLCAVLCSFLPCPITEPTMGFSGMLFVMAGISWGRIHKLWDMVRRNSIILIIPAFLPHINFMIHFYCLLAGYIVGRFLLLYKSKNSLMPLLI